MRRLLYADMAPQQPFIAELRRPNFAFPLHCHDFWEAFLCLSGSGWHEINGQGHALRPGDLWVMRPEDMHSVRPQHDFAYIDVMWPVANWDFWRDLAGLKNAPLSGQASAPHLEALFGEMTLPLPRGSQSLVLCRAWAEIAHVLEQREVRETRPAWMLKALQKIETEEGLRAGWPFLLHSAHISPGHLCREWKRTFDLTPTQWINARRLERAAALLLQSDLPIKEVSSRCGFENLGYFYRLFGEKYGCAPRSYRKKA